MKIAKFVDELYKSIIKAGTHLASSIKVAEASKAIENAQRDLNISFVNELALSLTRWILIRMRFWRRQKLNGIFFLSLQV